MKEGLTTETLRSQRIKIFSWPGDGGQEKVSPPSAEALFARHQIVSEWAVVAKNLTGGQKNLLCALCASVVNLQSGFMIHNIRIEDA